MFLFKYITILVLQLTSLKFNYEKKYNSQIICVPPDYPPLNTGIRTLVYGSNQCVFRELYKTYKCEKNRVS